MFRSYRKPTTTSDARVASILQPFNPRVGHSANFLGNGEPSLDEVMADEAVMRLMARDGVKPEQLRAMLERIRDNL